MIPILFDTGTAAFDNNGLGRLRDCISCTVTEERNGIYECDFEYPVGGQNYDLIQCGRIIGATHNDSDDVQPFDIVSHTKPIGGIVTFHAVHISYRQSFLTVKTSKGINSLSGAFAMLGNALPSNPFSYSTDKTSSAYFGASDGTPRTVKELLGGIEGSILDVYGGEYEFNRFSVILHSSRGVKRDFTIRYGVNMTDYNDETDISETYNSVVPYWTDGEKFVVGNRVSDGETVTGRGECVPLDVSDRFENKPTKAQVQAEGLNIIKEGRPYLPSQTIKVSFARLQDIGEEGLADLYRCDLCDTIGVEFPAYGMSGTYKIVKTVWNVLENRYEEMELGVLSTTLSEALGISNGLGTSGGGAGDIVTAQGTTDGWEWRKWDSGMVEAWRSLTVTVGSTDKQGNVYRGTWSATIGSGIFDSAPHTMVSLDKITSTVIGVNAKASSATAIGGTMYRTSNASSTSIDVSIYCWKK